MEKNVILLKHRRFGYRIIFVVLITLLITGPIVALGCSSTQGSSELEAGNPAPDFTLPDLGGNQITLSDLRGKIVFLNFWATTCPRCKAEMPDMETLYQKYKNQDVVIISIDLPENESDVRQFIEDNGYSWTFLLDKTGKISFEYEIKDLPTSFFLDTEGIIRTVNVGPISLGSMESNLNKAMNKG